MPSQLDSLKKMSVIVCDTGDINSIQQYTPQDATTNPSLILAAAQTPAYQDLVDEAIHFGLSKCLQKEHQFHCIMERLYVNFGAAILKIIPGRVSTEVDARLSFDREASLQKAITLIDLYESLGFERERILIKLASTWEGIQTAALLEKEEIHCNMTLLFDLSQAAAAAEAKATLISPFVGRILDWYKAQGKLSSPAPEDDPGVLSVKSIYNYYKHFGYGTEVMAASFRNAGEIRELAGCDLLTISPQFLDELSKIEGEIPRKLSLDSIHQPIERIATDEKSFRWQMNENAMAVDKLSEGIRKFAADEIKLENFIREKIRKQS